MALTTSCRCEGTLHYGPWLPEAAQKVEVQVRCCRQQLPAQHPPLQQGALNLSPLPPQGGPPLQPLIGCPGPVNRSGPPHAPPAPDETALPCSAGVPGLVNALGGSGLLLMSADQLGHWDPPRNKQARWSTIKMRHIGVVWASAVSWNLCKILDLDTLGKIWYLCYLLCIILYVEI